MKLPRAFVRFAIDVAKHPNDVRKIASDFREFLADAMQLRLPLCSRVPPSEFVDDDTQVLDSTDVDFDDENFGNEVNVAPEEIRPPTDPVAVIN